MKKIKMWSAIFASLFGFGSALSFADGPTAQRGVARIQHLTFGDLKAACLDPTRFHNQNSPTDIQVTCEDVQFKWVPDNSGTFSMNGGRNIQASIISDKYTVNPEVGVVPVSPQLAACPRFKKVAEKVVFNKSVACNELVNFVGTSTDFCAAMIDSVRSANPDSIEVTSTGDVVDLCTEQKFEYKKQVVPMKEKECVPVVPVEEDRSQRGQRGQRDQRW